jgi:hypothetical protein
MATRMSRTRRLDASTPLRDVPEAIAQKILPIMVVAGDDFETIQGQADQNDRIARHVAYGRAVNQFWHLRNNIPQDQALKAAAFDELIQIIDELANYFDIAE